jgi:hypothetical protein
MLRREMKTYINYFYSEQEFFDKALYYVTQNFELEDELKEKNCQNIMGKK